MLRQRRAFDARADFCERGVACCRSVVTERRESAVVCCPKLGERNEFGGFQNAIVHFFRRLNNSVDRIGEADENRLTRPHMFTDQLQNTATALLSRHS